MSKQKASSASVSTGADTNSPVVVLVHGFLDSGMVWDDVVAESSMRDVEFVRVNLAGMGDRANEAGPFTLERFAIDVAREIDAIDKPTVLVGQSLGAQVAELVAAARSDKVVGLVLLTPVPLAGAGLPDDAIAPFAALGRQPSEQRAVRRNLSVSLDEAGLERLGSVGDRANPNAIAASAHAWNQGHPDGSESTKYAGPVLVVRGEGDPFVTGDLVASAVVPRFDHPTVVTIAKAGHWPHVEQPKAFAKVLGEFLTTLSGAVSSQVPQQGWTQAFAKKSSQAFGDAFADAIVLEASALARPVEGRENVKMVMAAASRVYESLEFTHEAVNGNRNYLEWKVEAWGGERMSGVTVLTKNDAGQIVHVAIHHRPLKGLLKFSAELSDSLRGSIDASHFLQID